MLVLLTGCGPSSDSRPHVDKQSELKSYLDSLDGVVEVKTEAGKVIVYLLNDSSKTPCDEYLNFKNASFLLDLAFNDEWRNYLCENGYSIVIHNVPEYPNPSFEYVRTHEGKSLCIMHDQINDVDVVQKRLNYIADNFTCREYGIVYGILDEYRQDSIFLSNDTLFSEVYLGCCAGVSKSCKDLESIKSICVRINGDTIVPVFVSLNQHLMGLDSIK